MEYKKEFEPLYNAVKKLKKSSQIKGLSMGPPLGSMPSGVKKETAVEFTNVFFPAVKEAVRKESNIDPKKNVKFKLIKAKMKEIREKVMGTEKKEEEKSGKKLKKGDHVIVIKEGSHKGETCVISEVNWNGTGRLQVKMDGTDVFKSYLPEEVDIIVTKKKETKKEDSELSKWKTKKGKDESELSFLKSKGLSFHEQYALRVTYDMMCGGKKLLTKDDISKFFSQFHFELNEHDLGFLMGRLCELEDCSELPKGATFLQFALFAKRLIYSNRSGSLQNAFQILTGLGEEKTNPNPEEAELTTQQISSALKMMGEKEHDEKTIEAFQKSLGKRDAFLKTMGEYGDISPKTLGGGGGSTKKKSAGSAKAKKKAAPAVKIDKNDAKYKKYFKMVSMHLPKGAALGKARQDGLSDGEIAALTKML